MFCGKDARGECVRIVTTKHRNGGLTYDRSLVHLRSDKVDGATRYPHTGC